MMPEFTLVSHNIPIFGASISPEAPRGVVVLVHGYGEHSGRYLDGVVPFLLKQSLAVIMYDHFGHGRSGAKKGVCPGYPALLGLLDQMIERASAQFPGLPLLLYGHSMGGNLVLNRVLRNADGVRAVIASSPYLRLAFEPPLWKMLLGKALLRLMPSLTLDSGLDPYGISRIPEEVTRYREDPLVHSRISPVYSFPVMDAGEWAIANAIDLQTNTLLLHGTADPIIDFRATQEFHRQSSRTTLELFEGGFHELHHDLCRDRFFQALNTWLSRQLP